MDKALSYSDPKNRKGFNGKKKDQGKKSQNDNIFGSSKHIRSQEKKMEKKYGSTNN
jgi:hypothetical protein